MVTFSSVVPDDPMEIQADHIRLDDIAHSLSRIQRWNGATQVPFSVAEHCIHASDLASQQAPKLCPRLNLLLLLHDAHEAYLGDVVTPIKRRLGPIYEDWASHLDVEIYRYFECAPPAEDEALIVRSMDKQAMRLEAWAFLCPHQRAAVGVYEEPTVRCSPRFFVDGGAEQWATELIRTLGVLNTQRQCDCVNCG